MLAVELPNTSSVFRDWSAYPTFLRFPQHQNTGAATSRSPPRSLATTAMLRRSFQTLASVGARAHAQRAGVVGFQSALHAPVFGTEERSAADRVSHSRLAAAADWRGASHRVPIVPNAPSSHDLGVYGPYRAVLVGPAASREPRRSPDRRSPGICGRNPSSSWLFLERVPPLHPTRDLTEHPPPIPSHQACPPTSPSTARTAAPSPPRSRPRPPTSSTSLTHPTQNIPRSRETCPLREQRLHLSILRDDTKLLKQHSHRLPLPPRLHLPPSQVR